MLKQIYAQDPESSWKALCFHEGNSQRIRYFHESRRLTGDEPYDDGGNSNSTFYNSQVKYLWGQKSSVMGSLDWLETEGSGIVKYKIVVITTVYMERSSRSLWWVLESFRERRFTILWHFHFVPFNSCPVAKPCPSSYLGFVVAIFSIIIIYWYWSSTTDTGFLQLRAWASHCGAFSLARPQAQLGSAAYGIFPD